MEPVFHTIVWDPERQVDVPKLDMFVDRLSNHGVPHYEVTAKANVEV
jgi:hypothetical protein